MYKKSKKLLAWGLVVCMILSNMLFTNAFAAERLSGANRYETAAAIALAAYEDGADTALLAVGDKAADALAAAPLAAKLNAPILLTAKNELPEETVEALEDLGVKNVIIIGGTGAVSAEVADELEELGYDVDRISGADRFATSLAIAEELEDVEAVFVVNGQRTADALSVSPVAAANNMAIILVNGKTVSDDVLEFVDGLDVYVVGGKAVVSDDVLEAVDGERISGADRYATNVALMEAFADDMDFSALYVASGLDAKFADALAGGILAAMTNAPMILVGADLADVTADFIEEYVPATAEVFVLGGKNSVSASVVNDIEDLIEGEVAEELKVVEVSALNASQLLVVFNKPVNKSVAETGSNYVVTDAAGNNVALATDTPTDEIYDAKLQSDNKSVKLTFAAPITTTTDPAYVTLTINNMQEKDDSTKVMKQYVTVVKVHDKVAPQVTKVTAKTRGSVGQSVKIEFNEPVVSGSFKIDGSTKSAVIANNGMSATISGLSLDPAVAHTLLITNLTDTNNNAADQISLNFNVTKDTAAPTVQVTTEGDNRLVLQFSKEMDPSTIIDSDISDNGSHIVVKNAGLTSTMAGSIDQYPDDSSKTKFLVRLTGSLYASSNTATLVVAFTDDVKDSLGNKMDATTVNISITKDTVKPTITSATFTKNASGYVTNIIVNLSEGLAASSGLSTTGITVVDSTGVDVTTNWLAATSNAVTVGDKKVTFPLHSSNNTLKTGKYTFYFPAGLFVDDSIAVNTSDAASVTIDFGAASGTFKFTDTAGASVSAASNVITITYKVKMKGGSDLGSAVRLANYTLNGSALPEGTAIKFKDANQDVVVITLPANSVEKTDSAAVLRIANVQKNSGETMEPYTATVPVVDNIKPVLQSARLINNVTIELTYNEDISITAGAVVDDEFVIKEDGTTKAITSGKLVANPVPGFGKKITIVLSDATFDVNSEITVKANATGDVKDTAGNVQKTDVTVTVTK